MGWLAAFALFFCVTVAIAAVSSPRRPGRGRRAAPPPQASEDLSTADALARLGTPETVAHLVAQGRAEELRGLGYRGDLPGGD